MHKTADKEYRINVMLNLNTPFFGIVYPLKAGYNCTDKWGFERGKTQ